MNEKRMVDYVIEPLTPHSDKQRLITQFFMADPRVREMYIACGTKFGKTISCSAAILNGMLSRKQQGLWRWVGPIYLQSKIGFNYIKRMVPKDDDNFIKFRENSLEIEIPLYETLLQFYHAKHPTSLEGEGVYGYVLDETAKQTRAVYESARTTTTMTRGKFMFPSTPLGKNFFYEGCMQAKEEQAWALKHGRIPEKIFLTARTEDNPFVPRESIEEARRDLPDRLFRQFYLAEFLDDGTVFAGYHDCTFGAELPFDKEETQKWLAPEAVNCKVVIGLDWAKTVDWTVMVALDLETRRMVGFWRFNKRPFTTALNMACEFAKYFKDCEEIWHDKTGIGQVLDDLMAYSDVPFRGITFTNRSKADMVNRLIRGFEQRLLSIPRWIPMLKELGAFEVSTNELGTFSYSAPDGEHDDTVCALMLAYSALEASVGNEALDIKFLEDLVSDFKKKKPEPADLKKIVEEPDTIESLYQGLISDSDDDDF